MEPCHSGIEHLMSSQLYAASVRQGSSNAIRKSQARHSSHLFVLLLSAPSNSEHYEGAHSDMTKI